MDIVGTIVGGVPEPIRTRFRGTAIESVVYQLRRDTLELITVCAYSPVGPVTVTAPRESVLVELLEKNDVYEPVLTAALASRIGPETVYYDIGTRFGYYTKLASVCGVPASSIHGFEQDLVPYHVLQETHDREPVVLNRVRVGGPETSGVTIDEYATAHEPPTVVKIDVEGAEYDVLRGMHRTLEQAQPAVFVEMHPHKLPEFGTTPEELFDLFDDFEYSVRVETDHRTQPAQWRPLQEATLPTDRTYLIHAQV